MGPVRRQLKLPPGGQNSVGANASLTWFPPSSPFFSPAAMPASSSGQTTERLVEAADKVQSTRDETTRLKVVSG
jgi:hypothetical protein